MHVVTNCRRIPWQQAVSAALMALGVIAPASAYLDPGTGSLMVQMIIGGIVAGAAAITSYWHQLKRFVAGLRRGEQRSSAADPSDTE